MAEDWALDVCKYVPDADQAAIAGIVRHCGIALRNRDASLVSFSDTEETDRVRESFLKKKLGLTDPDSVLDAAIARVGEVMKADTTKNRVTVYYLLAEHFGKLGLFGGEAAAAAATPLMAAAAVPAANRATRRAPLGATDWGDYAPFLLLGLGGLLVYGIISGGKADAPAPAAPVVAAAPAIPTGAGVVESVVEGRPMVSIYFDTAKADIDASFAARTEALRAYMAANPDTHLQISGFNDPRGDAAFNADLSKRRAFAVRDALAGMGTATTAMDLVKPADTNDSNTALAEARRVDVTVVDGPVPAGEAAAPAGDAVAPAGDAAAPAP
jgi:hypothetical protein